MSLDNAFRAYGRYLVTWNSLQPVLDIAIVRELGLDATKGAVLRAAMNPKSRLTLLRGLMAAAGGEKADAVPLIAEMIQEGKRQPIVQGDPSAGSDEESISFLRHDAAGRMTGSSAEFSAEEMDAMSEELAGRIATLSEALGISAADVAALKGDA